jgi:FHS family glucose/mannose:H+ symporter-like MFS transporter
LIALATASFLAFGALLVLFGANSGAILEAMELDYAELGLLGSMLSLGLGVGIVVAGPIADRVPRRPLYVASCLVVFVATVTLGSGESYAGLLFRMTAIGLGAGFYETVINTLVVEEFGAAAPRRLLLVHSGAPLAACLTPLAIALAQQSYTITWQETFQAAGVLHLALIVGVFFVPMRNATRRVDRSSSEARSNVRSGQDDRVAMIAIGAATFAYVGVESAFTIFLADHVTTDLGLTPARAAMTISAFWGGLLVGRLGVGLAAREPGAGTTAALAALAAGLAIAFGLGWLRGPELATTMIGLLLGGVFPVMIGLAGMSWPSATGTAVGLAGGFGSLGGFVVPWFTGRIASAEGLPLAIATLGAWLALLALAAASIRLRPRFR